MTTDTERLAAIRQMITEGYLSTNHVEWLLAQLEAAHAELAEMEAASMAIVRHMTEVVEEGITANKALRERAEKAEKALAALWEQTRY